MHTPARAHFDQEITGIIKGKQDGGLGVVVQPRNIGDGARRRQSEQVNHQVWRRQIKDVDLAGVLETGVGFPTDYGQRFEALVVERAAASIADCSRRRNAWSAMACNVQGLRTGPPKRFR